MQKHAMALSYFILATFSAFASQMASIALHPLFITASIVAFVLGGVFFIGATLPQLKTAKAFLANLSRQAQQVPVSNQQQSSSTT